MTKQATIKLEKELNRVFRLLKKSVARQVRGELTKLMKDDVSPADAQDAVNEAKASHISAAVDLSILNEVIDTTGDQLASVWQDAGQEALKQIVQEDAYRNLVNQVNENAVHQAKERAAELVGKRVLADGTIIDNPNAQWAIDQTTRDAIRKTIQDGLADNIGYDAIVQNLQDSYAFSEDRAEMIAHTEIARANSYGALEGYKASQDLGVKIMKEWLADDEACDICMANEAQGAIPLDEEFESGDMAPGAHPWCECSISPVVDVEAS